MNTLTNPSSTHSINGASDATSLSHKAGTKAHNAVNQLSDGAHRMVDSLESRAANLEPKGRRVLSGAQSYVRANPLLSLGIAMAAGMVVRHFIRR